MDIHQQFYFPLEPQMFNDEEKENEKIHIENMDEILKGNQTAAELLKKIQG